MTVQVKTSLIHTSILILPFQFSITFVEKNLATELKFAASVAID